MHGIHPAAWASLVAGVIAVALAAMVYIARPAGATNRRLAAFLFALGLNVAWSRGVWPVVESPAAAWAMGPAYYVVVVLGYLLYLRFLATLDTPIVKPLRNAVVGWSLTLLTAALVVSLVLRPLLWFPVVVPVGYVWAFLPVFGPLTVAMNWVGLALWLFGLLVAISAYRRAHHVQTRRQLKAYVIGFAVYDAAYLSIPISLFLIDVMPISAFILVQALVPPLAATWLVGSLAYGILRTQLFDIDLRIKWSINRGTLAAIYIASFFVVSEIVAGFLSDRIGLVAGVLVTGILVFAIAPLQRLADRVSDAAMPHAQDTQAYRTVRKREVYRAALEASGDDGVFTERERDMLAALATQLGLTPQEARLIERQGLGTATGP